MAEKKGLGDNEEKLIVAGGIALVAYVGVIRPIMNAFGADPADLATIDEAANDPESNPFMFEWGEAVISSHNSSRLFKDVTQMDSAFWQHIEEEIANDVQTSWLQVAQDTAAIDDSFGWFYNDTETIVSTIKRQKSQLAIYELTCCFRSVLGEDFWTLLNYGKAVLDRKVGLRADALADCLRYAQALPIANYPV
ncbi:MAG: hypothetical protein V4501_12245 [Pseudomonadota bacterium]